MLLQHQPRQHVQRGKIRFAICDGLGRQRMPAGFQQSGGVQVYWVICVIGAAQPDWDKPSLYANTPVLSPARSRSSSFRDTKTEQ